MKTQMKGIPLGSTLFVLTIFRARNTILIWNLRPVTLDICNGPSREHSIKLGFGASTVNSARILFSRIANDRVTSPIWEGLIFTKFRTCEVSRKLNSRENFRIYSIFEEAPKILVRSITALLVSRSGNLCKQFGPRSDPTKRWV